MIKAAQSKESKIDRQKKEQKKERNEQSNAGRSEKNT